MNIRIFANVALLGTVSSLAPLASAQNPPAAIPPELKPPAEPAPAPPNAVRDPFVAPATEADFIKTALKNGRTEVNLAQLALMKTEDRKVKDFAQMVVADHTAANVELKSIADGFGIPMDSADVKGKQKYDDLGKKSGKAFDEAFLEEMASCHANDIAGFEAGKKVATSRGVTAFIDKTLPIILRRSEKINLMGPGSHSSEGSPPKKPDAAPTTGSKPGSSLPMPDGQ
jgi:putative membrane protein